MMMNGLLKGVLAIMSHNPILQNTESVLKILPINPKTTSLKEKVFRKQLLHRLRMLYLFIQI